MKKKKKQSKFVWKPSEYKLTPIEGKIILEIDEAGSQQIVTLAASIRAMDRMEPVQLLPQLATAIERLYRLKLVTIIKNEQWNNTRVSATLNETEIAAVLRYLSDCPVAKWFENHEFGPCNEVEICANYPTRG